MRYGLERPWLVSTTTKRLRRREVILAPFFGTAFEVDQGTDIGFAEKTES
jgi:hypothetical protein